MALLLRSGTASIHLIATAFATALPTSPWVTCHPPWLQQVTFVEALPNIMPGFDREIAKLAQRLLINSRPIDFHTNVIASKVTPGAPAVGVVGWVCLVDCCWLLLLGTPTPGLVLGCVTVIASKVTPR